MEHRVLPHGAPTERFSTLGLGLGGIQQAPAAEIRQVIETAIAHGINFFDLCAGAAKTYAPFGQAIRGRREQVFFQLHLGAVYNESGEYGWSRDLSEIQRTFAWELETLGTDYADFGFLHCVDDLADIDALEKNGILEFAQSMRRAGHLRHLGFSSHTPAVAQRLLDTGLMDMMMFSINPAYDLEQGDEFALGSSGERAALFRRCQAEGVGISVMKPFFAGSYPSRPYEETLALFSRALAEGSSRIAAAEQDGAVLGFCKVDLAGAQGKLDYLVVLPAFRGKGNGRALMDWAMETFRQNGVTQVEVKVVDGNDAIRLYEAYGFRMNAHLLRRSL